MKGVKEKRDSVMTIFFSFAFSCSLVLVSFPFGVIRIGNCSCYSVVKLICNCGAVLITGLTAL
jgi:hypothetical protein